MEEFDAVAESFGQGGQGMHFVVGRHDGTPAALDLGALGIGTDHRQALDPGRVQGKHALVLHQNNALGGDSPGQCSVLGSVFRVLFDLGPCRVQAPACVQGGEQATDLVVDHGLLHVPVSQCREQGIPHGSCGTRHFQIEPTVGVGDGFRGGPPVADDQTGKAPLLFEDVAQQGRMARGVGAVDAVVGGHHRAHIGLANRRLKGHQVKFAQSPLTDLGTDAESLEFGIVADEMLDAGPDVLVLDSANKSHGNSSSEVRILGVALEISPGEGVTVKVDGGAEDDPDPLGFRLFCQGMAHRTNQVRVPGRGQGAAHWETGGPGATDAIAPYPIGSVADLESRDAQARHGSGVPGTRTGAEGHLLLEGEGLE